MARLRVEDVKKQKSDRLQWENRKLAWRRLRHDSAIATLKSYLHSPEVTAPSNQRELLAEMASRQQAFQERRIAVLTQLSSLAPPELTEANATSSRIALEALMEEEMRSATDSLSALRKSEAEVAAEVTEAAAYLKDRLYHFAADPQDTLDALLSSQVSLPRYQCMLSRYASINAKLLPWVSDRAAT